MFTVRDFTKDLNSFSETLKRISDIGYTAVQVSGTCAFDADWLAEELKINGLICPATHTAPDKIVENSTQVAADHKRFGCGIAGLGMPPGIKNIETFDFDGFVSKYYPAAEILREAGILFGYHNHRYEFNRINGQTMMEALADAFPPDMLTFILDTYWIQFAGGDPAVWISKLRGRVHCVHLKDMAMVGTEQHMAVVGEGNINFDAVFAACENSGTQYLLVEQDACYGEDPFECLKRSYKYLLSQGLK